MSRKSVQIFKCCLCKLYFSKTKGHEFQRLPCDQLEARKEKIKAAGLIVTIMEMVHDRKCTACRDEVGEYKWIPEKKRKEEEDPWWDNWTRAYEDQ